MEATEIHVLPKQGSKLKKDKDTGYRKYEGSKINLEMMMEKDLERQLSIRYGDWESQRLLEFFSQTKQLQNRIYLNVFQKRVRKLAKSLGVVVVN